MATMNDITGFKQIFPSGKYANAGHLLSRKMTEWNLTNILRSITDQDSFVISNEYDLTKEFEFCVHGYYFCVPANFAFKTDDTPEVTLNGAVYVTIQLTAAEDSGTYSELDSISFSESSSTDTDTQFTLQLLDSNRTIPATSKIKFNQRSLNMEEISNTILNNIQTIDGNYPPQNS